MPRAPVLPSLVDAAQTAEPARFAGEGEAPSADPYTTRIVKYIPGEAIALFLPFASFPHISHGVLIAVMCGTGILGMLYAVEREEKLDHFLRRPWWVVAMWSIFAIFVWMVGTSSAVQHLLGWSTVACTFVLAFTAYAIPPVDNRLSGAIARRQLEQAD